MTIVLRTLPEYAAEVSVHKVLQLLDPSVSLGALLPLVSKSRMQANKTLHQTEIVTGAGAGEEREHRDASSGGCAPVSALDSIL